MDKNLEKLEYYKITDKLSQHCATEIGREKAIHLRPFYEKSLVEMAQEETAEAKYCYDTSGIIPLSSLNDVRPVIRKLKIHGYLSIEEVMALLDVCALSRRLMNYFNNVKEAKTKIPLLKSWQENLCDLKEPETLIKKILTDDGLVKDNASGDLLKIRRELNRKRNEIKNKIDQLLQSAQMRKYMQEPLVTQRNDRYVFPIKAGYKNHVEGIVHDQSSSGITLYIEPMSIVQIQNRLNHLELEEKTEIAKILRELSDELVVFHQEFMVNTDLIAQYDLAFAKALLAIEMKAVRPEVAERPQLLLYRAKHPLIDPQLVVANDLLLKDQRALVITGPNTGGKTVSLKTAGLMVLMHQAGLHLPVREDSTIGIFSGVFADIGDEQSIEQSLSTFSSHIKNISFILKRMEKDALVLFDELGSGTDPTEGASLAIAIIEYVLSQKAFVMATTHYNELKKFAYENAQVVNASVEFDIESLKPTYRLFYGTAGQSQALAIARQLGLNRMIIEEAKRISEASKNASDHLMDDLEAEKSDVQEQKDRYEALIARYEEKVKDLESRQRRLEDSKEKIIAKANQKAKAIIDDTKEEMTKRLEELKELQKQGNFKAVVDANALLNKTSEKASRLGRKAKPKKAAAPTGKPIPKDKIEVGMKVYVENLGETGTVVEYNKGDREASVEIGAIKLTVSIKNLKYASETKETQQESWGRQASHSIRASKSKSIKTSLDLRGQTVDEALKEVDKYIDDAYLSSLSTVTIIHGKGTGVLRQAISDYLKRNRHVQSYRFGSFSEGGNGVTVVELNH